ncbi:GH116 family glycosyl-hydrolase [Flavobacterium sp.]|uniref:GH116 family glycosyl-hydrolase n=1 Tax=Flavobacterium sp. TaxID=239 RepID=UPI00286E420A|nr:GH116 family glycosyl-hydrolase [Flavobacterium sp.]
MSDSLNNNNCDPNSGCCTPKDTTTTPAEGGILRRDFLKALGLATGGILIGFPAFGMTNSKYEYTIPVDKGLSPEWYKSLYERGQAEIYRGKELAYIGMPIGGIGTGTVYLGGDGKLWLWDIFNETKEGIVDKVYKDWQGKKEIKPRDGANFIFPIAPEYPFEQGFGVRVIQKDTVWNKNLDFNGFGDIRFKGQYPMAEINYRDAKLPVTIDLQSFSPFVPLDVAASSYPATIMRFKVTNTSDQNATVELSGWLENAVLNNSENNRDLKLVNSIEKKSGNTVLSCTSKTDSESVKRQADYGNMALTLYNSGKKSKAEAGTTIASKLLFPENEQTTAEANHGEQLVGALSKTVKLKPGESADITFIVSWYFPNLLLPQNKNSKGENKGRYYSKRFENAAAVAAYIANNYEDLYTKTIAWRNCFYEDATLPHWFLNRTFANTSILATETSFILEDGRFWGWEGIGCCSGTCTHVWHYAQALGRIFPDLEKNLRERTDFAVIDNATGGIDFRGSLANKFAADGQAGIVLRSYRDYLLSENNAAFLEKNWDKIKLCLQYLINLDAEEGGEANGTIFGEQHNTLDAEWYGNVPVITSLYLAALAAAVEMAAAMKDTIAEKQYAAILESGKLNIEKLFNGEFFIQVEDPKHKNAIGIGSGCYIDQVFGQGWAYQLGLGRLYNKEMIKSSLESLWKYNFVPDMGPLRDSISPKNNGRPYALAGDAGLVMCTWPKGGKRDDWEKHWQFGYFNEVMTGFEHQLASHMIWEDKLDYGFSMVKAIHERYGAAKRNPYNEIECSDHYSRAMASYGAFIAACGFTYNGPKGQLGFAPKVNPENFKAAFTATEGWGSFQQTRTATSQTNTIQLEYGKLALQQMEIALPIGKRASDIKVMLNKKTVEASFATVEDKTVVVFANQKITLKDKISVVINYLS